MWFFLIPILNGHRLLCLCVRERCIIDRSHLLSYVTALSSSIDCLKHMASCCWVLPAQVLWKELSLEDQWKMQSHSGMSSDMLSMTPDISLLLLETEVICEWQTGATLSLLGYCSDTPSSEIDRFMYQRDWIYKWTWSPSGFDADLLVSHICW